MNLAEGLPREIDRVRKVQTIYKESGPAAQFAVVCMEQSIQRGLRACGSNDVVEMVTAFKELEEYHV
jgi:hypothetical protein